MMFSKSLSVFLLLLASATAADVSPSSRNIRGSSSLMLQNRFLTEDEEASGESMEVETTMEVEATESIETEEEESVEEASEEGDTKKSRSASSANAPEERECEIEADKDEVKFKCKAKDEGEDTKMKDEITFKVKYDKDNGLTVKVEYESEIKTEETDTESETQYVVKFDKFVEYSKSATSGSSDAYDWENDTVIKEVPLAGDGLDFAFGELMDDGNTATFTVTTVDETGTMGLGAAEFTFTINRGGMDQALTANKMKIDFELMNYEWMQDDTFIALLTSIETELEVDVDHEGKKGSDEDNTVAADGVTVSFNDILDDTDMPVFGEFTWATDATVRTMTDMTNETEPVAMTRSGLESLDAAPATTIQVVATSPRVVESSRYLDGTKTKGEEKIAFSFIGNAVHLATDIYWDPEAGVGYEESGAASPFSMVVMGASILSTTMMYLFM